MLKSILSPSIICLVSISLIHSPLSEVKANPLNFPINPLNSSISQNKTPRLQFKLSNRGIPDARIGGATRSTGKSVIAIIPSKEMPLTYSETPTIFVYIPKNNAITANLIVKDENGQKLYSGDFIPPQKSGILRIQLPKTLNLKAEKPYKWEVELISPDHNPIMAAKFKTNGWLEKIPLNQEDALKGDTWTQLNTLAEAGIWYDTLEQLALLRLANPEDQEIELEWTELLKSVGLNNIANSDIFSEVIVIK